MSNRICILGLGNPGPRYSGTRHNIGFEWLDSLASSLKASCWKSKYDSEWASVEFNGCEVHLLKPQTFMNESGKALAHWKSKNQGEGNRYLVVYDDLDLPVGRLRLRYRGSDGGHRGLRSIIEHFGSQEIPRLRIGIDRPPAEAIDYVLTRFTPQQLQALKPLTAEAARQLEIFLNEEPDKAMNQMNSLKYGEQTNGS